MDIPNLLNCLILTKNTLPLFSSISIFIYLHPFLPSSIFFPLSSFLYLSLTPSLPFFSLFLLPPSIPIFPSFSLHLPFPPFLFFPPSILPLFLCYMHFLSQSDAP